MSVCLFLRCLIVISCLCFLVAFPQLLWSLLALFILLFCAGHGRGAILVVTGFIAGFGLTLMQFAACFFRKFLARSGHLLHDWCSYPCRALSFQAWSVLIKYCPAAQSLPENIVHSWGASQAGEQEDQKMASGMWDLPNADRCMNTSWIWEVPNIWEHTTDSHLGKRTPQPSDKWDEPKILPRPDHQDNYGKTNREISGRNPWNPPVGRQAGVSCWSLFNKYWYGQDLQKPQIVNKRKDAIHYDFPWESINPKFRYLPLIFM